MDRRPNHARFLRLGASWSAAQAPAGPDWPGRLDMEKIEWIEETLTLPDP